MNSEELKFKIRGYLHFAETEKLLEISKHLGLDESKLKDQAGWLIVKEIEKLLEDSVEKKTDEKDKEKLLNEFLDVIFGKSHALEGEDTTEDKSTITELEAELEKIKLKHEAEIKEALNRVEATKIKIKTVNSGNDAKSEQSNMDHLKTILNVNYVWSELSVHLDRRIRFLISA